MKIAFICKFSHPSRCGVWSVVYNTAKELQKRGHEIHVFSSNRIKGTNSIAKPYEVWKGITFHRFPAKWLVTEGAWWDYKKALMEIKPDIIHAHEYRHPHSIRAPQIAKKLGVPCYLTTHAPFLEKGIRNPIMEIAINLFDICFGKKVLNSYKKVFAIAKWEIPLLIKKGCKKERIYFLPNGVAKDFFKIKPMHNKKAIYMGRIAPVKNLEIINKVAKELPGITFTIHGPIEKGYELKVTEKNIKLINRPYDMQEEIKEFKKNSMFILPSKREGIPLALLEGMASGLACISSRTQGGKEVIEQNKTGLLFNNAQELKEAITKVSKNKDLWGRISKSGRAWTKQRTWEKIAKELEKVYKEQ